MAWHGMAWHGTAWHGMARHGMAWHQIFGEVAEGLDTLQRINEAFVDDKGRPFKNIRIRRVHVLDDPFDDPPGLAHLIPDASPPMPPPAAGEDVRLEDDWVPMDEGRAADEVERDVRRREAQSRGVVLEMVRAVEGGAGDGESG
ncbi:unnamed protein product [Closterium sp. NIES-53]